MLKSLDEWNRLLFLSIGIFLLFIAFFKIEPLSELLVEGLVTMSS